MSAKIFRSLKSHNYRVWTVGSLVSNLGQWMQSIAQDWLVLTQLTHHDASAVGIVVALQYGPQLLLMPFTGSAADRFDQRKLLLITQAMLGLLALSLGLLTITGLVELWHVYIFAFLLGCVMAFDTPVRQVFVTHLVSDADLMNAVALNSAFYNVGRMIGPALAGLIIASIGTGWAFIANGLSFVAVLISLCLLRTPDFRHSVRAERAQGGFIEGLNYVWARPDLKAILLMTFLLGTFGFNFTIFIGTMAVGVFHADAGHYGLLSSMMAIGTLAGALISASRVKPGFGVLLASTAAFGLACTLAAFAPNFWLFGAALVILGLATLTFTTETNSVTQLSTEPSMRGRVMALRLVVMLGGMPVGAPIMGWVANAYGPRWALGVGAASGIAAALVAAYAVIKKLGKPGGATAA